MPAVGRLWPSDDDDDVDDDGDDEDDDEQTKPGGSGMLLQRAGTHRATWLQVPAKVGFKVVFVYLPILYFFVFQLQIQDLAKG